ncbi:cytochrome P450 [Lojkania enalia]|uniref:Cytochrome P450 n=1 Tax=Lojkania enalia TaxID=147567 RepID=A0A9P4K8Z8_9PLEO|nr:cytochrome P450 [Didymosphaeria enalia]
MPEDHDSFWGHLKQIGEFVRAIPASATFDLAVAEFSRNFPSGVFYLDCWPFGLPLVIISSPHAASQLQEFSAWQKPDDVNGPFEKMTAGPNMLTMHENIWKQWRSLFNPSFAAGYIMELAPNIAKEVGVLCSILKQRAQEGQIFELEILTANLALDVIGTTSLDAHLRQQEKVNPFARVLKRQVEWVAFGQIVDPWKTYNPMRPFIVWNNNRLMRKYIGAEIDRRFAEIKNKDRSVSTEHKRGPKSIISLALEGYLQQAGKDGRLPSSLDTAFRDAAISQIIVFMIAGHETTSTTICMAIHSLSTNQAALTRIRAEHDEVFGKDSSPSYLIALIRDQPERLNQLPYTLAIIRETLRLYPPASKILMGSPSINLTDDDGKTYPTTGYKVWAVHTAIHRNPKYWPDPDAFIPERWLAKEGDPLYPVKGAWRPFEFGVRNCIGQTLAVMEVKVALLMLAREFNFSPAYPADAPEMWGSKAHLVKTKGLGGKPSDSYPCTVTLAK